MSETKVGRIAIKAYERAKAGLPPAEAWVEALEVTYSGRPLQNQKQHTCPKMAFSILCHDGELAGVRPGSAPKAEKSKSANYTREALGLLRAEPEPGRR